MSIWRDTKKAMRFGNRSVGYAPKQVDHFLTYIGAGHAAGVEPSILRSAISAATFPVVRRGYDRDAVDAQLAAIAEQLSHDDVVAVKAA